MFFIALIGSLAFAEVDYAQAKKFFQQGQYLFDRGQYTEAAENFERAYEITNDPLVLSSLAWSLELAGDLQQTIIVLQKYFPHAPSEEREKINERIENLKKRIRLEIPIETPEPPQQKTDENQENAVVSAFQPIKVNPDRSPPLWLKNTMFGVSATTGLIALVTGTQSYLSRRKLETMCNDSFCPADAQIYVDRDRSFSIVTDICWSVSLGAAGAGIWLRVQSDKTISIERRF